MSFDFSFAQLVGLLSFGLGVATFCQKSTHRLKVMMLIFNVTHLCHFLLMGAPVSALGAFISTLRTTASIYLSSIYLALGFMATNLLVGLWLATAWFDLFAVAGTMIGTFSMFMLTGTTMRFGFLAGSLCWLINNIIIGSLGGVLLEITLIGANLFTVYRLLQAKQAQLLTEQ